MADCGEDRTFKGEEIVISGIAGLFPSSDNVREFTDNLYNKKDMVTKTNEYNNIKYRDIPKYSGKISGTSKFDAQFFRVTPNQAASFGPLNRKILELSYSAIFDSGINPLSLSGTKLGVFFGSSYNDLVYSNLYDMVRVNSFLISGCSTAMMPNRVSYWIDGKGPSYAIDQGTSSTFACLESACRSISSGECNAAIVAGASKIVYPYLTLNLKKAGLLCLDGKTKCFDKNGDGYTRSDAVCVLFIQKAKDAKRIYTEICQVYGNYFARPDAFLPEREPQVLQNFFKEFYLQTDVCPHEVEYIEAMGSAIAEADGNELEAIGKFFGSKTPVKVGCLNSNMGNTEAATGVCALAKLCIAYKKGMLPANLHYNNPQDHIPAVRDGNVHILTDNTTFNRGYSAINHFNFTGTNYHVLLKGHYKAKKNNDVKASIPYIVPISGRHDSGVNKILNTLADNPVDEELIALLHNIFKYNIPGNTGRGYIILDTNEKKEILNLGQNFEWNSGEKRPVWFLYSGMGSQWPTMGRDLMRIPIFAAAIEKCHRVLEPKGLDIVKIISSPEQNIFDNILHSFVGITATQIGLTDILAELGIVPNNIIGHSLGEIGCAYADGCLTAEETILSAYNRGYVSINAKVIRGSMAAVGLGYNKIKDLCPSGIEIACHNSSESSTLSGPTDIMKQFIDELTSRDIFAKEVPCSNIAYHSKYISDMGPDLLSLMKRTISQPKLRSNKWICTSVPQENWEEAKYASAEYFTHNLLNPVYFEEASLIIPENAIIIEIAPHGLLQAIMKRSHKEYIYIPLTKRKHVSPVNFFLKSLGKMYLAGLNPTVNALYPKVEFPVSTETPILSDLVEWEHSETWYEDVYTLQNKQIIATQEIIIDLHDDDYKYFTGHVRDGINVLPESALLVFVWETYAMYLGMDYKKVSVKFENMKFFKNLILNINEYPKLFVSINRETQNFEVTQEEEIISTGVIKIVKNNNFYKSNLYKDNSELIIYRNDIYTYLESKGFSYRNEFQSIYSSNVNRNKAMIEWTGDWVTFLDGIFQLNILDNDYEGVSVPNFMNSLSIDVDKHNYKSYRTNIDDSVYYDAEILGKVGVCGGVLIESVVLKNIPKKNIDEYSNVPSNSLEPIDNIKLLITNKNNLPRLKWEEAPRFAKSATYVQVSYAGLQSISDYQNVCKNEADGGQHSVMDFGGYNNRGEKVMGIVRGTPTRTINPDFDLLWPVPDNWSLEDAATVPLPYLIAYYCLAVRGEVFRNERVLVTDGAGALAQAVISICIAMNSTVYAIVDSINKKIFLLKLFPELKETNIICSCDPEIINIFASTKANRCEIVINFSSGKMRKAVMNCVCLFGAFLDLSYNDMIENEQFGMYYLEEDRTYKHVNLYEIFKEDNIKDKILLQKIISDGIVSGAVRPLSRVSYSPGDVQRAYQLVSEDKDRVRVLIRMEDLEWNKILIQPRIHLSSKSVYVVVCDKTRHAVEFIDYFSKRGGKKFSVHVGENVIGYLQIKMPSWKANDIEVVLHLEKLQQIDECTNFLEKSKLMGRIEGIFIFHNGTNEITNNIDLASREICEELRYFAFIDVSTQYFVYDLVAISAKRVCESRKKLGLPAVVVCRQKRRKETIFKESNDIKALLYDLEMTLRCNNIVFENDREIKIEEKHEQNLSFLAKLEKILGVKTIKDIDECLTLKEFHLLETKNEEIRNLVNETYQTSIISDELQEMTIACLKNIMAGKKKINIKRGIKAFYTYIEKDVYVASEPIIKMKTKLNKPNEKEEEVDSAEVHLIMLPGYEGQHGIFQTISEGLKIRAVTAHYDYDLKTDTIQKIALNIFKNVMSRFKFESKFYLFGYSFGVNVALELATLLEREGYTGVVFCLDSSPDALRVQTEAYLGNLKDNELENNILTHMYKITSGNDEKDIENKLLKLNSWSEKVRVFIALIKQSKVTYSLEYLKDVVKAAYTRIKIAQVYKPNFKLESELILMKGTGHPKTTGLEYDYNLSKYTKQEVKVFDIESDHTSAPQDRRVTSIVNRFLDPQLLKDFKMKNKCDFYYTH